MGVEQLTKEHGAIPRPSSHRAKLFSWSNLGGAVNTKLALSTAFWKGEYSLTSSVRGPFAQTVGRSRNGGVHLESQTCGRLEQYSLVGHAPRGLLQLAGNQTPEHEDDVLQGSV